MNPDLESEHNRVRGVLVDTISLLCKSSLTYSSQLKIEGVIGITVDGCIFLVHIDQQFGPGDAEEAGRFQFNLNAGVQIKSEHVEADVGYQDSTQCPKKQAAGRPKATKPQNTYVKVEPNQIKQESGRAFHQPPAVRKKPRQQKAPPQGSQKGELDNIVSILDDYAEEEEQGYGMQDSFDDPTFDPSYEMQDETSGDWYEPPRKTTKSMAARSHRGSRHSSGSSRRNTSLHQDGTSLVITESSHICGYPGCFKRFKFRHDLLRHQTKKHGRKPAFTRARMSNASASNGEEYYYGADEDDGGTFDGEGGYDYGYQ